MNLLIFYYIDYSYASHEVEEGYYTAKVSTRETEQIHRAGHAFDETGYKITAMFLDSSVKAPHSLVFAGGSGNVKYDMNKGNLELQWLNIVMADDSLKAFNKTNATDLEFAQKIVVSSSLLHLNMLAKCGMTSFDEFNFTDRPTCKYFISLSLISNCIICNSLHQGIDRKQL